MSHKGYKLTSVLDFSRDLDRINDFSYNHNSYIYSLLDSDKIDPVSSRILFSLYPRHRVFATVLCEYQLRYSEAILLRPERLFCDKTLQIFQPKTRAARSVNNSFRVDFFCHYANWRGFNIFPSSYESLKLDIFRCTPRCVKRLTRDIKDGTHIFRHLWASYKLMQGVQPATIGLALGHSRNTSVYSYLHEELADIF